MDGSSLVFDFHSFLSDDTTQIARTVHCHMMKLANHLMKENILRKGIRILSTTDGRTIQYTCSTAIYLMCMLALVVDRDLCAPGHGK